MTMTPTYLPEPKDIGPYLNALALTMAKTTDQPEDFPLPKEYWDALRDWVYETHRISLLSGDNLVLEGVLEIYLEGQKAEVPENWLLRKISSI